MFAIDSDSIREVRRARRWVKNSWNSSNTAKLQTIQHTEAHHHHHHLSQTAKTHPPNVTSTYKKIIYLFMSDDRMGFCFGALVHMVGSYLWCKQLAFNPCFIRRCFTSRPACLCRTMYVWNCCFFCAYHCRVIRVCSCVFVNSRKLGGTFLSPLDHKHKWRWIFPHDKCFSAGFNCLSFRRFVIAITEFCLLVSMLGMVSQQCHFQCIHKVNVMMSDEIYAFCFETNTKFTVYHLHTNTHTNEIQIRRNTIGVRYGRMIIDYAFPLHKSRSWRLL